MNIIELAKQVGLKRHQEHAPGIDGVVGSWADLEAFTELVRADEREACAKLCEDAPEPDGADLAERIRARGTT